MPTRIRYEKLNNTLFSRQTFVTPEGRRLTVKIDLTTLTYTVKSGDVVLFVGTGKTLNLAKSGAKAAMMNNGLVFGPETRMGKKKLAAMSVTPMMENSVVSEAGED